MSFPWAKQYAPQNAFMRYVDEKLPLVRIAGRAPVEVARGTDPDPEERNRGQQVISQVTGRGAVELPVGQVAVDLVADADVRGRALPSGHYLAEEAPEETLAEMSAFFGG